MAVVSVSLLCILLILYIVFGGRRSITVNVRIEHCGAREIRRYALPDDNESEIVYERGGDALELITYRGGRSPSMAKVPAGSSVRVQTRKNIMLLFAAAEDIVKVDRYV